MLQLRVAQLIPHGVRAGQGGLCCRAAVPRLRGRGPGTQGASRFTVVFCVLFTGRDSTRGSGQEVFVNSLVESGRGWRS